MTKSSNNIKRVVGAKVYGVWLDMLRALVPCGRTHRLAVIVAGMLQYASAVAAEDKDVDKEGSVAWRLVAATETSDPEEVGKLVLDLLKQLFDDAGVKSTRSSVKGMPYSIVEDAIEEYVRWEDMPWE